MKVARYNVRGIMWSMKFFIESASFPMNLQQSQACILASYNTLFICSLYHLYNELPFNIMKDWVLCLDVLQ